MKYSQELLDAIENHDFSETNILLKKALDNDEPEALASLAENLTDLGFSDLAKEVYRALIAKFPHEDIFKVYLAEILLNDGQEDDGLTLLYGVSKESDAYVESLLAQADYYQTNGLIEAAKQKLLEAQNNAPDQEAILFGLAELDYMSGNFEEALKNYRKLFETTKTFGEVVISQRIAACLAQIGDYEEASKIIKKNSTDLLTIDAQYEAGLIMLANGDNKEAIKFLDQVIETQPDYVNAYPLLARAYANENNNEEVLQAAQTGLSYNEFDETLYSLGARAAANLNDKEQAEKLLKKGLKVAPDNSDLRLQLSNLYLHENKDLENLKLFEDLEDDQIEPQAHWNMALSYQRLEKYDKAKSEFLLAYPSFQNNPDFLKQMLTFFREIADNNTTKALLEKYLQLVPEDSEMQALYDDLSMEK
ncbi:tetratricopeptide repeat protein [Lactobacillus hominis]|uniref:Putative O-linked transferase n=2 Tax=Lactobacillus hominis TaxID=1203033 RepID=I7IVJ5_9LACO|nr:tetratricopeptide repeat protein [Lactobacillus hominis]KRM85893.1 TPR repeat-containing protein [Lactobacillus hominis DSM 23910 = CRBIP 24.179]MCT3348872.1 peptide-binding protein [Lactobacillus hominis]CCI81553.1 Putative O-linked transferase [Lactobacillus hominis DSM 23910 = CRBIP 24.179]